MNQPRRELFRILALASVSLACVSACAGMTLAAGQTMTTSLWECNYCHQQYQGNSPPPFAKCPAKEMKQNHWWIKKS